VDRSGNEDQIYANTISCNAAIEQAARLQDLRNNQRTARFQYTVDSPDAARIGFAAFSRALPFLYGTCDHLGEVTICASGQAFHFRPGKVTQLPFDGAHILERQVVVVENDAPPRTLKTVRLRKRPDSYSSLVVVLEQSEQRWRVSELPVDFPRLFSRFPIRTSDFLPVNAIIDGRFD